MKPEKEIKIGDILGEGKYKSKWLDQKTELSKSKYLKNIAKTKKEIFQLMEDNISKLSEFSEKNITIYKKKDYSFNENAAIKISDTERKPEVTSNKIEWKNEDYDNKMVFQVNFANSSYGGGTFGDGFVQEEIKNVLSTTASILTANNNHQKLDLNPRNRNKPTPVVIVGQIKDFDAKEGLPYGRKDKKWGNKTDSMITKSNYPNFFNELAIAANPIKCYGEDDSESAKALFNNAFAGFQLAKEVAGNKKCKIKTGLFGAGAFHNSPEFSIAMQYLASRIADIDIEFCGIDEKKHDYIKTIFDRVNEMISSKMSLDSIVNQLMTNWKSKSGIEEKGGWRKGTNNIPPLNESVFPNTTPSTSFAIQGRPLKLTQNSLDNDIIYALQVYEKGANPLEDLKTLKININKSFAKLTIQDQKFLTPKMYSGIGVKTKLIYDKSNCQVKFQIAEVFPSGIAKKLGMEVGNTIVIRYENGQDPEKVAHKAICAIRNLSVEDLRISYDGNAKLKSSLEIKLKNQDSGNLFYNEKVINNFNQTEAKRIISNLQSARVL